MLQHCVLLLLLVRCAKAVFLVGGLGVRYQTNRLREVAIILLAVSFYGIGQTGRCNSKSRILDKLEEQIRVNFSLFLLALKRKFLNLCL
jgi:hypothetical protein